MFHSSTSTTYSFLKNVKCPYKEKEIVNFVHIFRVSIWFTMRFNIILTAHCVFVLYGHCFNTLNVDLINSSSFDLESLLDKEQ